MQSVACVVTKQAYLGDTVASCLDWDRGFMPAATAAMLSNLHVWCSTQACPGCLGSGHADLMVDHPAFQEQ